MILPLHSFTIFIFLSPLRALGKVLTVPNAPYNGPSSAEFKSGFGGVDSQRVIPYPNATSFEWWYFDVASHSEANESVIVTFFETTSAAFIGGPNDTFLTASLGGTFKNGTIFNFRVDVSKNSSVYIDNGKDKISATWGDTGFSFKGKDIMKGRAQYVIKIDNPARGIHGNITFRTRAPAHYACGTKLSFFPELVMPNIGWSNAIPDADAFVDMMINGERLSFNGVGYHDKNWGDRPFRDAVKSWYWGHASVGPYSVVWFDARATNNKEYISGYVAKDGRVLQASCQPGTLKARPYGNNSTYPPVQSLDFPEGFRLEYDLGRGGMLSVNISATATIVGRLEYWRFTGKARSSARGRHIEGRAIGEHFVF